ncbi:MAG: metal-dependent hydrolase [Cellvibrionaceae bacterium]
MDPLTQGVVGALVAQTTASKDKIGKACMIGALAGMAPDLDVLIRSSGDPLLALEFHRHFTHSLLFVPIGGLICALALFPLLGKRWNIGFWELAKWCWLGYATHGLLDAFTSYGTQLLWPFSNYRVAWDGISVIDPLFTLPILGLLIYAARKGKASAATLGIIWGASYLALGLVQHQRAMNIGETIAAERGHTPINLEAKPSFANLIVWKVVYETEDNYHVDAVRPGLTGNKHWAGDSIPKLDIERDLPWLDPLSQQAKDIERFRWFSAGYIAVDKHNPNQIIDIRYSMLPQKIDPLWGIRLAQTSDATAPAMYYTQRSDSSRAINELYEMLFL